MKVALSESNLKQFKKNVDVVNWLEQIEVFAKMENHTHNIVLNGYLIPVKLKDMHDLLFSFFYNEKSQGKPDADKLKLVLSLFPLSLNELPF